MLHSLNWSNKFWSRARKEGKRHGRGTFRCSITYPVKNSTFDINTIPLLIRVFAKWSLNLYLHFVRIYNGHNSWCKYNFIYKGFRNERKENFFLFNNKNTPIQHLVLQDVFEIFRLHSIYIYIYYILPFKKSFKNIPINRSNSLPIAFRLFHFIRHKNHAKIEDEILEIKLRMINRKSIQPKNCETEK